MIITLPADPSSNLDWEITSEGLYFLDFGWKTLDPFDPAVFNANLLAVEEFAKRFPDSKRVVLARTSGQFSRLLAPSEKMEERRLESGLDEEIFCAELFSEYLHRLASVLPDDTEPVVMVDLSERESLADMVLLFCKRRFEHFKLLFSDLAVPIEGEASTIVSLPQDEKYDPELMGLLFNRLKNFKCIPEELLNEHWDEVDAIIVDPQTLGAAGRRMLCGFEAAGGLIISTGGPMGFENEASLDLS